MSEYKWPVRFETVTLMGDPQGVAWVYRDAVQSVEFVDNPENPTFSIITLRRGEVAVKGHPDEVVRRLWPEIEQADLSPLPTVEPVEKRYEQYAYALIRQAEAEKKRDCYIPCAVFGAHVATVERSIAEAGFRVMRSMSNGVEELKVSW